MTKLKADREVVSIIIQDSCDSMDKIKEELPECDAGILLYCYTKALYYNAIL